MIGFDTLPGNTALKTSLRAALASRLPQAVLLTGPAGSGKMTLARILAAALLCTGGAEPPCGSCNSCRKAAENIHPDLTIVDEGERDLPVALARQLRQEVCVLPNDGDRRVVIIRHAHKLNTAAQNALLKVLEEPPNYAFFILTCEQPGLVLETIRSRCVCYQLEPPCQSDQAQSEETLSLAASFVHALAQGDEFQMLQAAMAMEKLQKASFQAVLGVVQTALRDAIFEANAVPGRLIPTFSADISMLAVRVSASRLLKLYDHLSMLSGRCEINAAPTIQCAVLCAGAYQICFL